ncbi:germination protein M [Thermoactinomyces sp. DSM 45891]|uniref:GerMN domain-containing protein n=1 Tax=Thermoactinomyces sp. DSM 45891 TaxID=1761907 RepID=UPI000922184D|nr:GerMN domain-containing protein [Thermoactinomyces sp. DSM 45891]SFX12202.1 germination protein M [Thermoactinomyces sp. DSM 45891]
MNKKVCAALIVPLLLVGCMGQDKDAVAPIDPPPADVAKKMEQASSVVTTTPPADSKSEDKENKSSQKTGDKKVVKGSELYFLTDSGYVVPYTLSKELKNSNEALSYLVEDQAKSMVPKGFQGALPKGTKIKGVQVKDGVATVDFSKEFTKYDTKKEEHIFSAITWTVTQFGNVKTVNLNVEGKPYTAKSKMKTQGLSRQDGINLEMAKGVDMTQSMPVTLYFMAQSEDRTIYYVPVTRMINRADNRAKSVLQELVRGPELDSKLLSAVDSTLAVNNVALKGDTVTADLGEQLLQFSAENKASKNAIDMIVLSLTENTAAKTVKFLVNGKDSTSTMTKGEKLSEPVSRPEKINAVSM